MIFNEIYGTYYKVVAEIIDEALNGSLNEKRLDAIVSARAFSESILIIPEALKNGTWPLIDNNMQTPIRHSPSRPLTLLQKRWLKSLLTDPRISLFAPSCAGLEDIEPLLPSDRVVYFDAYTDGDPYGSPEYIGIFRTILKALHDHRKLMVRFKGHNKQGHSWICTPYKLEYSAKDDKFRLITAHMPNVQMINLARIDSCELLDSFEPGSFDIPQAEKCTIIAELTDERNALARAMLHFSDLEKETVKINDSKYKVFLTYDRDDETEILIRILSFGPLIKILSPQSFIDLIKERLKLQENFCR